VNLGFAGRWEAHAPVHRAITALTVGEPLQLASPGGRWVLQDKNGTQVGQLSESYATPEGMRCISASVGAIVVWRNSDSKPEYQHLARCEHWEVVVPELVFGPG
jgi:ATP-dependent DNA helicase RecQ